MILRTNPRLAKLANEDCICPVNYDFRRSKFLNIHIIFYKGKMDRFFTPVPFRWGRRGETLISKVAQLGNIASKQA